MTSEPPSLNQPGITIVYGKPPSDWRQEGVFLTADQPTPTA